MTYDVHSDERDVHSDERINSRVFWRSKYNWFTLYRYDFDKDGKISLAEIKKAYENRGRKFTAEDQKIFEKPSRIFLFLDKKLLSKLQQKLSKN